MIRHILVYTHIYWDNKEGQYMNLEQHDVDIKEIISIIENLKSGDRIKINKITI